MELKTDKMLLVLPKNADMQCVVAASLTQAMASFMSSGKTMEEALDTTMRIYKTMSDWAEEQTAKKVNPDG